MCSGLSWSDYTALVGCPPETAEGSDLGVPEVSEVLAWPSELRLCVFFRLPLLNASLERGLHFDGHRVSVAAGFV